MLKAQCGQVVDAFIKLNKLQDRANELEEFARTNSTTRHQRAAAKAAETAKRQETIVAELDDAADEAVEQAYDEMYQKKVSVNKLSHKPLKHTVPSAHKNTRQNTRRRTTRSKQ